MTEITRLMDCLKMAKSELKGIQQAIIADHWDTMNRLRQVEAQITFTLKKAEEDMTQMLNDMESQFKPKEGAI